MKLAGSRYQKTFNGKWLSKFPLVHDIDKYPEEKRNYANELTEDSNNILYSSEQKPLPVKPIVESRKKFIKLIEGEDWVEPYSPKKIGLKKCQIGLNPCLVTHQMTRLRILGQHIQKKLQ